MQFPPPPHFRGKPDDGYDVESYLYVEGELIRVKGPNDKMPQLKSMSCGIFCYLPQAGYRANLVRGGRFILHVFLDNL